MKNMSVPIRFGTYEVFRIILPGLYFTGLSCLILYLFCPTRHAFLEFSRHQIFVVSIIAGSIFAGLILYEYDHPKRIKAYESLEMPSEYLKKKLCDKCWFPCENRIKDKGEAIDTYFYILFEIFSASAQQRIFYIGSVYHVLADIRMLSFVFGILMLVISFSESFFGCMSFSESFFGIIAGSLLLSLWLYMHPEFFCEKNLSKGDKYLRYVVKMQKKFIDLEIETIKSKICKRKTCRSRAKKKNLFASF